MQNLKLAIEGMHCGGCVNRVTMAPAWARLEEFLIGVGRRKMVKPLYEALAKTPDGKARARAIYAKARPGYHPITQTTVDAIVK